MKTKRILSLVLVAVMVMFAFTACGDDEKAENTNTPEGTVKACVEEILDADFKGAIKYVSEKCNNYETLENFADIDKALEEENMSKEEKEAIKGIYAIIIDVIPDISKSVNYKVKEKENDGNNAVVTLTVPAVLHDDYEPSSEFQGELMAIAMQCPTILAAFQEETIPNEETIKKEIQKVLPKVVEAIENELGRVGTDDIKVDLEKINGEWKIVKFAR